MNTNTSIKTIAALATAACLSLAAGPAVAQTAPKKPAAACTADLRTFDSQLQKDGYWLHGAGYGYGYPMYGYGGAGMGAAMGGGMGVGMGAGMGYGRVRPGYEVRTLIASAHILAQRGEQAGCASLLRSARGIYTTYSAELRSGKVARMDMPVWRSRQIAAAVPVTDSDIAFRSDQLVGSAVVNAQGEDLGSVDDIVVGPQSEKIAFLVIGRGGLFGFNEKYVPVPWDSFKVSPGNQLLVLATTKATLDAAPQVEHDRNFQAGDFAAESVKVNAYWAAHPAK